jgi:hypothetical protein
MGLPGEGAADEAGEEREEPHCLHHPPAGYYSLIPPPLHWPDRCAAPLSDTLFTLDNRVWSRLSDRSPPRNSLKNRLSLNLQMLQVEMRDERPAAHSLSQFLLAASSAAVLWCDRRHFEGRFSNFTPINQPLHYSPAGHIFSPGPSYILILKGPVFCMTYCTALWAGLVNISLHRLTD